MTVKQIYMHEIQTFSYYNPYRKNFLTELNLLYGLYWRENIDRQKFVNMGNVWNNLFRKSDVYRVRIS